MGVILLIISELTISQSQDNHVVRYLYRWVGVLDVVLQMTHEHEVTGLIPAAVQSMMVNVTEYGAGSDAVCAVLGIDKLAQAVHEQSTVLSLTLLLVLLRL